VPVKENVTLSTGPHFVTIPIQHRRRRGVPALVNIKLYLKRLHFTLCLLFGRVSTRDGLQEIAELVFREEAVARAPAAICLMHAARVWMKEVLDRKLGRTQWLSRGIVSACTLEPTFSAGDLRNGYNGIGKASDRAKAEVPLEEIAVGCSV
jgi:hypothetical protein